MVMAHHCQRRVVYDVNIQVSGISGKRRQTNRGVTIVLQSWVSRRRHWHKMKLTSMRHGKNGEGMEKTS